MPTDLAQRAEAIRLSLSDRVRLRAGTTVGDAAALLSRLLRRGSGASIRGQILTRAYPRAFATLVQGRRIASITGTNGKTTTTHLLAAAVREALGPDADRLVTNADGANLHYGIASALAKARRADVAVLETDERVVPDLITHGHPEILVLLNFSRDQLDRNHELTFLARAWRQSLEKAGESGPTVIANSDDPLVTWVANAAHRAVWVDTASSWTADAALCPACGDLLTRAEPADGLPTGRWDCPGCDLTEPDPDYQVRGNAVELPDGSRITLTLNVPGSFNISNAACALAAAIELGVSPEDAVRGFQTVRAPAGRFSIGKFGATTARLVLSKNPAGWAESLPLVDTDPVILAIDSVAADGKDVSWLWDVNFEQLRGRHVICTGPRAYDLAVRLEYAEVDHDVIPDLTDALRSVPGRSTAGGSVAGGSAAGTAEPVDLIATYTPFQKLLKMAGLR